MTGRKLILPAYEVITNGDMSQPTITGLITCIQYMDNIALEMDWTGTPVGTFTLYGSLSYLQDANGNVLRAGVWNPITLSPAPVAAGAAGSILMNLDQLSFPYIQLIYTRTSGSGTLTAFVGGKML